MKFSSNFVFLFLFVFIVYTPTIDSSNFGFDSPLDVGFGYDSPEVIGNVTNIIDQNITQIITNINLFDQSLNTTDSVQFVNLDLTGNLTLGQKITFALGEMIDNIIDSFITITANLNVTGELIVSENSTLKGMINITGVPDGLFTCYIFNPNGGCMVGGNETCNVMFSPDGLSSQELCN